MANNTGVIYRITNPIGQKYIGKSLRFENRVKEYKRLACRGQQFLYRSFVRYGVDNHIFEIIKEAPSEELGQLEIMYIEKEKSYFHTNKEFGLNLTLGGELGMLGWRASEETKLKMSNSAKKRGVQKHIIDAIHDLHNRRVIKYDKSGTFLKEYLSMKAAALDLGLQAKLKTLTSGISKSCRRVEKSYKGFIWRYYEDCSDINNQLSLGI